MFSSFCNSELSWTTFASIFLLVWSCFWVIPVIPRCSDSFQPVVACYGIFRFVWFLQTLIVQNLICKFIKNELHVRFWHTLMQALLQKGAALIYYKVAQVLSKSGTFFCITMWGKWYWIVGQVLHKGTIVAK